jgi:hypothetical protein
MTHTSNDSPNQNELSDKGSPIILWIGVVLFVVTAILGVYALVTKLNILTSVIAFVLTLLTIPIGILQVAPGIVGQLRKTVKTGLLIMMILLFIASIAVNVYLLIRPDRPVEASPSGTPSSSAATTPPSTKHQVAVPSYFYPGSLWTQMESGAPTPGLAIINPNSGPGTSEDPNYADQLTQAEAKGIIVVGYIATAYAGTQDHTRTLAAVEQDVDKYYSWYPKIDGIFVDEVSTDCSSRNFYYKPLYDYIKAKGGVARVVLDPGTNTSECYMSTADIIVNFEDTYANYVGWSPDSWVSKYSASRFWQIIISTSPADMPQAVALSRSRNAGWVYVTNYGGDNPFDTLPSYWSYELFQVNS